MNTIRTLNAVFIILAISCSLALSSQADQATYQSSVKLPSAKRTDKEEDIALRKAARITMEQALEAAQEAVPGGQFLEGELESEDGNVIYEFEFLVQGIERTVIVDAGNGKILKNFVDRD